MEINDIFNNLTQINDEIKNSFTYIEDYLTRLLKSQTNKSTDKLNSLLIQLEQLNNNKSDKDINIILDKNQNLFNFDEDLNELNSYIKDIKFHFSELKKISEEMDLIALNAMVISIKSGEKGKAFSRITDNLKRLSSKMNETTKNFISNEEEVSSYIFAIQNFYELLSTSESNINEISDSVSKSIQEVFTVLSDSLNSITNESKKIDKPLTKAKDSIRFQYNINQLLEKTHNILNECWRTELQEITSLSNKTERLDRVSFELTLIEISKNNLTDINQKVLEIINTVKENCNITSQILLDIEDKQKRYTSIFKNTNNDNKEQNLFTTFSIAIDNVEKINQQISNCQQSQKNINSHCKIISKKILFIHKIFKELEPILEQLHHVKILQEIEISKNPTISSVKNSVIDMDKLISSAKEIQEKMSKKFEKFINKINSFLKNFELLLNNNNVKLEKLKALKSDLLNNLSNHKIDLIYATSNLSILSDEFIENSKNLFEKIESFENIKKNINQATQNHQNFITTKNLEKQKLLEKYNINFWEIQNNRYKELIAELTELSQNELSKNKDNSKSDLILETVDIDFF